MYQITIEINGIKLQKEADTIDEVRKIVYAYVNGEQKDLEQIIQDIINKPKNNKKDGSNMYAKLCNVVT